MDADKIKEIFDILDQYIKIAETELEYDNPYTLLVAVVLSAQSTDAQVNKVTDILFNIADTPQKMIKLGIDKLLEIVKSIGLYKTKAKNIIRLSQELIDRFDSEIPDNREDLMSLPGVGRKSSDVMLNIVYNQPTIAVDTHVFRVSTRLKLIIAKTRDLAAAELEEKLSKILPYQLLLKAHHLLVLHGRYVCKAKNPACDKCPLAHLCSYRKDQIS